MRFHPFPLALLPLISACSLVGDDADLVDTDDTDALLDPFAELAPLIDLDDPDAVHDLFHVALDASYIAMQAHNEAAASWVPDLQGIDAGEEVPGPTDDVGETLDACVEVDKAIDRVGAEETHLILDLSYELCHEDGRAGALDVRHQMHAPTVFDPAPEDEDSNPIVTQPSSQEVILAGYKQGTHRFDGVLNWDVVADGVTGLTTYEEDGAYTVEVDVSAMVGVDEVVVAVPLEVTQVVSGQIDASGTFSASGTATFAAQGRTAEMSFTLNSSPDLCPDGGLSGTVTLTSEGSSVELPLDCWDAAGEAGLYNASHLLWLKSGSDSKSCPDCDLSRIDVDDVNYAGGNLSRANLTLAQLSSGTFRKAKFRSANLTELSATLVDFREADFTGATMNNASLLGADLRGANLSNVTGLVACISSDLTGATIPSTAYASWYFDNCKCPDGRGEDEERRCWP